MKILDILEEINLENGSNYKKSVFSKYKDNELLQRVLKMTYDKKKFKYWLTMKNVNYNPANKRYNDFTLDMALDFLEEKLCTREITGNNAIFNLEGILEHLTVKDAEVLKKIIDRDLKINFGRTLINKVFKDLISKRPYSRCDIGTKKNVQKNIDFNEIVYSQVKMDGTYRSADLDENIVITSRSGEEASFPLIEKELELVRSVLPDVVLTGELTLKGELQRSKGNGLINSDNPPHEDIIYTVWDAIPFEEYSKDNGTSLYVDRLNNLKTALAQFDLQHVKLIEYKVIKNMKEAYKHFQEITAAGGEGTVIKAHDMKWKNGTSKQQLKVKLEIMLDMRCTGFTKGTKGTKREKTFGAMTFQNDEGTIIGQCSGFTDKLLEEISSDKESYIGRVFEIKCNDITQAKGNDYHALSHGNFVRFRDKDETDTLERSLELKELAMELK